MEILFDSRGLQLITGESMGCSILGILKVAPPPTTTVLLNDGSALLFVVATLFLPFLATDITLVALSAFF